MATLMVLRRQLCTTPGRRRPTATPTQAVAISNQAQNSKEGCGLPRKEVYLRAVAHGHLPRHTLVLPVGCPPCSARDYFVCHGPPQVASLVPDVLPVYRI